MGGVSKEWFLLVSRQIFNQDYALFTLSAKGSTYQPSPNSDINADAPQYFRFIGRFFGKAMYDGVQIEAYFTRSFYKQILGQQLTYHDLEDLDYELYKNLRWIVYNDVTDLQFYYTFMKN